jgi:hypothetical protein
MEDGSGREKTGRSYAAGSVEVEADAGATDIA